MKEKYSVKFEDLTYTTSNISGIVYSKDFNCRVRFSFDYNSNGVSLNVFPVSEATDIIDRDILAKILRGVAMLLIRKE